jgi:mono/diheme cytochrome c family protein
MTKTNGPRVAIAIAAGVVAALATLAVSSFEAVGLADYSGNELFWQFCSSCHGESGRGDGPVAPSLVTVPADLTRISERYGAFPAARVRETIDGRGLVAAHGTRAMPIWGYELWVEEGADVAAEKAVREAIDRLVEHVRMLDERGESIVD